MGSEKQHKFIEDTLSSKTLRAGLMNDLFCGQNFNIVLLSSFKTSPSESVVFKNLAL